MKDSAIEPKTRQTILIVDDSRVVRRAVSSILNENYSIIEAEKGEAALSLLHANPDINIVLLDMWMPDMDGFEVLEAMRGSDLNLLKILPVIIITGHEDDSEMRSRAETLGAADFIGKPFSASALYQSVQKHILPADTSNIVPFKAPTESIEVEQEIPAAPAPTIHSAAQIRHTRESYLHTEGNKQLKEAIETQRPLSVLHFQVDRVKTLLHTTDTEFTKRTLYSINQLIQSESRRKDLLVRTGPADFVLVMPQTDNAEAREVTRIIYRAMRFTSFQHGELKFRLSLSGGLAVPKLNNHTPFAAILALAYVRLKRAHSLGGDQLVFESIKPNKDQKTTPISLDKATDNLRSGHTNAVKPHLILLLRRLLPLLVYANSSLKLNIDSAIKRIHDFSKPEKG
jgi:diguanylate cyclase (GGDEF)-like protein